MAREVRIDVLCDVCLAEDVKAEGEEIEPTTIGLKAKPKVVALCKNHQEAWEAFRDLLEEYGQSYEQLAPEAPAKGSRAPRGQGSEECLICGKTYAGVSGLRGHVKDKHDMTLAEMRAAARGEELPLETETKPPKVTRAECDMCEVVYEWPETQVPTRALGIHKRKVHGIAGGRKVG